MGMFPARNNSVRSGTLAEDALLAAIVFATSWLGIALISREGGVAPIWVADAFIVYFALRRPLSDTPRTIAIGITARFFAGLAIGSTFASATVFSLCNLIEVLIVTVPLRAAGAHYEFSRPKSLLAFYALAGGPAPFAAALLASAFLHFVRGAPFLPTLVNWYAADGLGLIVLVPILCTVRIDALLQMFRRDQLTQTLLCISAVVTVMGINFVAKGYPLAFLFFPAVLFLTFQKGFEGGAIGTLLVTAYLISPALYGQPVGGLHGHTLRDQILIVEIYIAVVGFSVVLTGAALEERKRLEQSLSAATDKAENAREEAIVAKDAAEKANRMKSMFLATMSHELRTPLNAVIGFSQMMEEQTFGPLGDPHYQEYTGLIQKAGRHLLDLINDILDMSKIEAGKFELNREAINCHAVVDECVVLMRERARRNGIALSEDQSTGSLTLFADPRAIKQILLNLLSNAVKFTPQGGRVTAKARECNGAVAISVTDTGVGIPADQLYRLGNPFVQLRNNAGAAHEGTGLGLALVRSLAELHGGTLKIESVEGRGTTVTVAIPIEQSASLAA
jgi:signal transduction histidine kinase